MNAATYGNCIFLEDLEFKCFLFDNIRNFSLFDLFESKKLISKDMFRHSAEILLNLFYFCLFEGHFHRLGDFVYIVNYQLNFGRV